MALDPIPQRQLDLGPAGFFRAEPETPAGNQVVVKAGFLYAGSHRVYDRSTAGDQATAGFASVSGPGFKRYDLVYLDATGAALIAQGNEVALAAPIYNGAPGFTSGPDMPDQAIPVAYVYIDESGAVTVTASDITAITGIFPIDRHLDGYYVDKGLLGSAPTGVSSVVTTLFAGESQLGSVSPPYTKGVVTAAPDNYVHLLDQKRDEIRHQATDSKVYGRITYAASVWTLSYYFTDSSGAETAIGDISTDTTLGIGGLTNVRLAGVPKIFARADTTRPMFQLMVLADQVAGNTPNVPLGGIIGWQPLTPATAPTMPTTPVGWEYCDGQAVSLAASPYHPANLPGFLKPSMMQTTAGGTRKFLRGANYNAGTHGGATAEPVGGTDTIASAGGVTPFSGTASFSASGTTDAGGDHSHGNNTGDAGSHYHLIDLAGAGPAQNGAGSFILTDTAPDHHHSITASGTHTHPVSLSASGPFSGSIDTSHDHGGDNKPAFTEVAWIMRVL